MKIRSGFVSNSSSSSFVVVFPRRPENVEELHSWLFPHGEGHVSCYGETIPTTRVAEKVFHDLKGTSLMEKENIKDLIRRGWVEHPEMPDFPKTWGMSAEQMDKAWEDYERRKDECSDKIADSFMNEYGDLVILSVEYSDGDGPFFATMEHGDIFRNVPHIRISHH